MENAQIYEKSLEFLKESRNAHIPGLEKYPWHGAVLGENSIILSPLNTKFDMAKAQQVKSLARASIQVTLRSIQSRLEHDASVKLPTGEVFPNIEEIMVEDPLQRSSIGCLVGMPVAVWSMIPKHDSFQLIEYIWPGDDDRHGDDGEFERIQERDLGE